MRNRRVDKAIETIDIYSKSAFIDGADTERIIEALNVLKNSIKRRLKKWIKKIMSY